MLIAARDLVTRLPDADESESAWRCPAICAAAPAMWASSRPSERARHGEGASGQVSHRRHGPIGPAGSHPPAMPQDFSRVRVRSPDVSVPTHRIPGREFRRYRMELGAAKRRRIASVLFCSLRARRGLALLRRSRSGDALHARRPIDQAGRRAAAPRAKSTSSSARSSARSRVFSTSTRDDDNFRGVVRGAGRDTKSPSSARAVISYDVRALELVEVAGRRLGPVPAVRRARAVQPLRPGQGRRRPSDPCVRAKSRSPAVRPASRSVAADTLDVGTLARSAVWTRIRAVCRARYSAIRANGRAGNIRHALTYTW